MGMYDFKCEHAGSNCECDESDGQKLSFSLKYGDSLPVFVLNGQSIKTSKVALQCEYDCYGSVEGKYSGIIYDKPAEGWVTPKPSLRFNPFICKECIKELTQIKVVDDETWESYHRMSHDKETLQEELDNLITQREELNKKIRKNRAQIKKFDTKIKK